MKHRSVIAYVIVAAALFAAPQLSHDLQTFRNALGSRVSVGLMRTFLSLPSAEDAAARTGAPLPAETQLASCTKQRPAAKRRKAEPARASARAAEAPNAELAMIVEPSLMLEPPGKALGELAMIIPPDSGIDPRELSRLGAAETRRLAERARADYVAARFEGKGAEWRKADEALRSIEVTLPGSYEFRVDRDGKRTKVLKVRRGAAPCCPAPARPAPRPAGVDAASIPMPATAVAALAAFVSE
jgi:hypothetical protein